VRKAVAQGGDGLCYVGDFCRVPGGRSGIFTWVAMFEPARAAMGCLPSPARFLGNIQPAISLVLNILAMVPRLAIHAWGKKKKSRRLFLFVYLGSGHSISMAASESCPQQGQLRRGPILYGGRQSNCLCKRTGAKNTFWLFWAQDPR